MKSSEVKRFAALYERHLKLLKLQGKSKSTIDAYSLAVRRIRDHYDCSPDKFSKEQLENYFGDLVETHSWSNVKIDRVLTYTDESAAPCGDVEKQTPWVLFLPGIITNTRRK